MPKDASELFPIKEEASSDAVENVEKDETPSVPEEEPKKIQDPETGAQGRHLPPRWARYLSNFFSPVLIPTYCVALAMWITELSHLSENTRFIATFVVLATTAIIPSAFLATVSLRRRRRKVDNPTERPVDNLIPGIIFVICILVTAYYLYSVYAPQWLVMILIAVSVTVMGCVAFNFIIPMSEHLCGMGTICAVAVYLSREGLTDVPATLWVVGLVALSGLVGSARMALQRQSLSKISAGFVFGAIVTYLIMNIHLFDAKTLNAT